MKSERYLSKQTLRGPSAVTTCSLIFATCSPQYSRIKVNISAGRLGKVPGTRLRVDVLQLKGKLRCLDIGYICIFHCLCVVFLLSPSSSLGRAVSYPYSLEASLHPGFIATDGGIGGFISYAGGHQRLVLCRLRLSVP